MSFMQIEHVCMFEPAVKIYDYKMNLIPSSFCPWPVVFVTDRCQAVLLCSSLLRVSSCVIYCFIFVQSALAL